MNAIGQSNFLQALGWAVLNSLWQMAILWVLYQLITGIARKTNSSNKSILAAGLLIAGFSWFVFTFFSIYITESAGAPIVAGGFAGVEGNQQLNQWLNQTLPLASILYLILLVLPLLHYIRNYRYVQVIRQNGLSKADVEWRMFVKRVAAHLGIKKPVHIWVSEFVTSPVTIGHLKPVILVPLAAINHLSTPQMEAVLLHELAHIRRCDYFINLILKFIQSILYFNPFVKAFVSIVEREREKSCDEMVMQFQYDAHGYASALLVLEKANHFPKPLAVAASGKKQDLLHRIEWIMGVKKKPVISFNKLAGMMAGLLCIIGLNAVLILSKPSGKTQPVQGSFSSLSSPLYFFTDDFAGVTAANEVKQPEEIPVEANLGTIINDPGKAKPAAKVNAEVAKKPKPKIDMEALAERVNYYTSNPYAAAVAYLDQPEIPALTPEQEKQVKEAINASKKLFTEGQWREVERNLAEVLTQTQKEVLKTEYKKQLNKKMDLNVLEQRLALAYDRIDWDRINTELNTAVTNIQLDSLNRVYSQALANLSQVEKELNEMNITSIPDSDISIETVEARKKEVLRAINTVKKARTKKIVHL